MWALGLSLIGYWGYSQAAIRLEQARLEESLFGGSATAAAESDALTADLASATASTAPVLAPGTPVALIEIPRVDVRAMVVEGSTRSRWSAPPAICRGPRCQALPATA